MDVSGLSEGLLPFLSIFNEARRITPAFRFPYTEAGRDDKRYKWSSSTRDVEVSDGDQTHTFKITIDGDYEKVPREVAETRMQEFGYPTVSSQLGVETVDEYSSYSRNKVLPQYSVLQVSVSLLFH